MVFFYAHLQQKNNQKEKLRASCRKLAVTGILKVIMRASDPKQLCTTNLLLNRLLTTFSMLRMTKII